LARLNLRHLAAGILLGGMFAGLLAAAPPAAGPSGVSRPESAEQTDRIREGAQIVDRLGHFQLTGERVTFVSQDGSGRFVVLESLSLQRVVRTITESSESLKWNVSGTATEFQGSNYLLLQRAILKNQAPSAGRIF